MMFTTTDTLGSVQIHTGTAGTKLVSKPALEAKSRFNSRRNHILGACSSRAAANTGVSRV